MVALAERSFLTGTPADREISARSNHIRIANAARDYYQAGEFSKALQEYQKLKALYPADADLESLIGATLLKLGRLKEAQAHLEKSLTARPDVATLNLLGAVCASLGRLYDALSLFERAAYMDPEDVEVIYNLALTLGLVNRYREAVMILDSRLDMPMEKPEYLELQDLRREIVKASLRQLVTDGVAQWSGGKPKRPRRRVKLTAGPPLSEWILEARR